MVLVLWFPRPLHPVCRAVYEPPRTCQGMVTAAPTTDVCGFGCSKPADTTRLQSLKRKAAHFFRHNRLAKASNKTCFDVVYHISFPRWLMALG